jgi:hypothetical protein
MILFDVESNDIYRNDYIVKYYMLLPKMNCLGDYYVS